VGNYYWWKDCEAVNFFATGSIGCCECGYFSKRALGHFLPQPILPIDNDNLLIARWRLCGYINREFAGRGGCSDIRWRADVWHPHILVECHRRATGNVWVCDMNQWECSAYRIGAFVWIIIWVGLCDYGSFEQYFAFAGTPVYVGESGDGEPNKRQRKLYFQRQLSFHKFGSSNVLKEFSTIHRIGLDFSVWKSYYVPTLTNVLYLKEVFFGYKMFS